MTTRPGIEHGIEAYSNWRERLRHDAEALGTWLAQCGIDSAAASDRLDRIGVRLGSDRLYVAVLAEFSRGKSELINAVFFGALGQRLLPSTVGRTTMCPTELFHEPSEPPYLRLLPIETRSSGSALGDYRNDPDAWHSIALDPADPEAMARTLEHLTEVRRMSTEDARNLGFVIADSSVSNGIATVGSDIVEVPRWRHALVNFPHSLLSQGMVILDTPGLNALGSEPDLTVSLLANAHAAVFLLAADTGVTRSDLTVWQEHVANEFGPGCEALVVLNKIDTLWDDLEGPERSATEIRRQREETARTLGVALERVFPVSARQGLLARVRGDDTLLARSGILAFEEALAQVLLPARRDALRESLDMDLEGVREAADALLAQRLRDTVEHTQELAALSSHNTEVVQDLLDKVERDRQSLERNVQRFQATRSVFTRHAQRLRETLARRSLEALIAETRKDMSTSLTSAGLRTSATAFFEAIRGFLDVAAEEAAEAHALMESAARALAGEGSGGTQAPAPFSMQRHRQKLRRLEEKHLRFLRAPSLVVTEQMVVTRRFYASVAGAVREVFSEIRADADNWLVSLIGPLETRMREHQIQLRRRLESIKRIHKARDQLDERLAELAEQRERIVSQRDELEARVRELSAAVREGTEATAADSGSRRSA